jgi:hypothetical protein
MSEDNTVERLVMPDYRVLTDNFTEIVAYQLHYFEGVEKTGEAKFAYTDLKNIEGDAIKRYQYDWLFRNKVQSMVAMLMRATQEERDNRVAGLPFKQFRIVEA